MMDYGGDRSAKAPRGEIYNLLDAGAKQALEEVGPEASSAILSVLETQRERVQNPSAYVLKAVGNAKKGKGAGGAVQGPGPVSSGYPSPHMPMFDAASDQKIIDEIQDEYDKLITPLDDKALGALDQVSPEAILSILRVLNKQGSQVNNPNAYVVKAVGNEKRGVNSQGGTPPPKRMRPSFS